MTDHEAAKRFMLRNFRHFNAATIVDAAEAWVVHLERGDRMFLALAGAMSTAEIGITLAEMIRENKVHALCTTGANMEEDVYKLVAHEHYRRIPNYRDLTPADELSLFDHGLNRVTDTCIPETEAMRKIDHHLKAAWLANPGQLPHRYFYDLLRGGQLEYQAPPSESWMLAAAKKDLPLFVPGWADSTSGNVYVAEFLRGNGSLSGIKGDLHYMAELVEWYKHTTHEHRVGFFQIGGGISGDFPICTVPLINQDLDGDVPLWNYFAQISDATPSYGSYSGASPNEKITWGKLSVDCPKFAIESDATIVAPLIFAYVLAS